MKPQGHTAVMAEHAPAKVEADDARRALHRKLEYFPTPPWAARAGGELIAALDPSPDVVAGRGQWWCWEPACGEGHMAHGLADYFARVYATDIHDHGSDLQCGPPLDFLSPHADAIDQADWIVTNPPFGLAAEFVRAGLRRARRGVAMLARSGWLDSQGRYRFFYDDATAPDLEFPFFERVPMSLGRWEPRSTEPGGSSATPYSWFVWFKDASRPRWLRLARTLFQASLPLTSPTGVPLPGMLGHAIPTIGIPPGTKARLTRPDDARLFARAATGPDLFNPSED